MKAKQEQKDFKATMYEVAPEAVLTAKPLTSRCPRFVPTRSSRWFYYTTSLASMPYLGRSKRKITVSRHHLPRCWKPHADQRCRCRIAKRSLEQRLHPVPGLSCWKQLWCTTLYLQGTWSPLNARNESVVEKQCRMQSFWVSGSNGVSNIDFSFSILIVMAIHRALLSVGLALI